MPSRIVRTVRVRPGRQPAVIRDPRHLSGFLDSLTSKKTVSGATHTFYRYPARFSPEFAREAIRLFSKPGEVVLDPFMGGGTTAVEALAEGRRFVGNDINRLAHFVSTVKTTTLTQAEEAALIDWASNLRRHVDLTRPDRENPFWSKYQKNLPWWLRRLFAQALSHVDAIGSKAQQDFARCSLLRTAQWALDCKSSIPGTTAVFDQHLDSVADMLHGLQEFRARLCTATGSSIVERNGRLLLSADATQLHTKKKVRSFGRPRLILTSPPYIGVHVLYHRWQILGRKETAAPYWIANKLDGHSGVFYTFADRRALKPDSYMEKLRRCFGSVLNLMDSRTALVQLVAFQDPDIQLPIYLSTLDALGLQRCEISGLQHGLQREVPNRKWYANLGVQSCSSTEFLIVHRRSPRR